MAHLFARIYYGAPEAFYRALRPYKAPLLLLAGTMLGMPIVETLFFFLARCISHDPRWFIAMITGTYNGSISFVRLNGVMLPPLAWPDSLRAAAAHLTPWQEKLSVGAQWWFQLDVCLGLIAMFWLMWRLTYRPKTGKGPGALAT